MGVCFCVWSFTRTTNGHIIAVVYFPQSPKVSNYRTLSPFALGPSPVRGRVRNSGSCSALTIRSFSRYSVDHQPTHLSGLISARRIYNCVIPAGQTEQIVLLGRVFFFLSTAWHNSLLCQAHGNIAKHLCKSVASRAADAHQRSPVKWDKRQGRFHELSLEPRVMRLLGSAVGEQATRVQARAGKKLANPAGPDR